jgi:hypothetical protein
MQLPSEKGGTADFPVKVGVAKCVKEGDQELSDIKTYMMLGIYQMGAKMPRRDEVDFFSKAIGDYFRDTKTFSYCYDAPFSMEDVDLVLRPKISELKLSNSILGTTIGTLGLVPFVNLAVVVYQLVGLPQETFSMEYDLQIVVETPAGKKIAEYQIQGNGSDSVNLYEQPFGNYMWYDSVFQKEFFMGMDSVKEQMKADHSKILAATSH